MSTGERRSPFNRSDAPVAFILPLCSRTFLIFPSGPLGRAISPEERPDIYLPAMGGLSHLGRLSLGQPGDLETIVRHAAICAHAVLKTARLTGKIKMNRQAYVSHPQAAFLTFSKLLARRSTASRYSTSFRATARVARLRLPLASSLS